jgi:hypothetical protein
MIMGNATPWIFILKVWETVTGVLLFSSGKMINLIFMSV